MQIDEYLNFLKKFRNLFFISENYAYFSFTWDSQEKLKFRNFIFTIKRNGHDGEIFKQIVPTHFTDAHHVKEVLQNLREPNESLYNDLCLLVNDQGDDLQFLF